MSDKVELAIDDALTALGVDLFINPCGVKAMALIFATRAKARKISPSLLVETLARATFSLEIYAADLGERRAEIYLFPFGRKLLHGALGLPLWLLGEMGRWRTVRAVALLLSILQKRQARRRLFHTIRRGTTAALHLNDVVMEGFIPGAKLSPCVEPHLIASHLLALLHQWGTPLPWQDAMSVIEGLPARDAAKKDLAAYIIKEWRNRVTSS